MQETTQANSVREYLGFPVGAVAEDVREHGAGFALKNTLMTIVEPGIN